MGWGTGGAVGAEGLEWEDEAAAVEEVMMGEGWNENIQLVAALGCMSWKHLH